MERIDLSRAMLEKAFYYAFGSYTEQEAKKLDQWRDENWWKLCNHIAHEVEEIRRSDTTTKKLHNLCDLVGLAIIMLTKGMLEAGLLDKTLPCPNCGKLMQQKQTKLGMIFFHCMACKLGCM